MLGQQPFFSAFVMVGFSLLMLLLVHAQPMQAFVLTPVDSNSQFIYWLTAHLDWFLLYWVPAILIFPNLGWMHDFMSPAVAIRLPDKWHYTLASVIAVNGLAALSVLILFDLPLLIFAEGPAIWSGVGILVSVMVAATGFFCLALWINDIFALGIYLMSIIVAGTQPVPFLVVTANGQSIQWVVINLATNTGYLVILVGMIFLALRKRETF